MRRCLRSEDLLGRIGGEEYVAIVTDRDPESVIALAEQLRACVRRRAHSATSASNPADRDDRQHRRRPPRPTGTATARSKPPCSKLRTRRSALCGEECWTQSRPEIRGIDSEVFSSFRRSDRFRRSDEEVGSLALSFRAKRVGWGRCSSFRHPREGRDPLILVIPAKAGIHSLPSSRRRPGSTHPRHPGEGRDPVFVLIFRADAKTDSRPCELRRPSWPPSYFSLLAQREVTKRKAPSAPRRRCAPVRYGRPGFR